MIDINLKGTLYTAAATLPHLIAAGGGDFVSLASRRGPARVPGRGGLQRDEVRPARLHARARPRAARARRALHDICPGGVATDFALGHRAQPRAIGARRG